MTNTARLACPSPIMSGDDAMLPNHVLVEVAQKRKSELLRVGPGFLGKEGIDVMPTPAPTRGSALTPNRETCTSLRADAAERGRKNARTTGPSSAVAPGSPARDPDSA
jgi:hypothetical protein